MSVYSVDKLMSETRRLAAQYHNTTGQTLPVTLELARFDAIRLLGLKVPQSPIAGVDAIAVTWEKNKHIQIKGRVIFDAEKRGHRIGQLNIEGLWDSIVLVILDMHYEPLAIHCASRELIMQALQSRSASKRAKRGAMSIAKFIAIGQLLWSHDDGFACEGQAL